MSNLRIEFKYYKGLFPIELARRYNTSYFQENEIRKNLLDSLTNDIQLEYKNDFEMDEEQFKCGNEIFPESAISDPLSDLDTFDEWRGGIRIFPHKGRYAPFGIEDQLRKIESSVSFGVVGEILAGLFCQSYFAPYVLVRNIRRWPDFIFHKNNRKFVFVESKATASKINVGNPLDGNFEANTFKEFLSDSMKSILNSETTNVCLSQTRMLGNRSQRVFHLNILELESDSEKDPSQEEYPETVVAGLATQVADQYIGSLFEEGQLVYSNSSGDEIKKHLKNYNKASTVKIKEILIQQNNLSVVDDDHHRIEKEVESQLNKLRKNISKLDYKNIGKDFKDSFSTNSFKNISTICNKSIFSRQLNDFEDSNITTTWEPDWSKSIVPFENSNPLKWRCSNSILFMGRDENMDSDD